MSELDQAQRECIELFNRGGSELPGVELAAPFLSVPPKNYDPAAIPSVLYVGKATGGDWYRDSFVRSPTVRERRLTTTSFLDQDVKTGSYRSAFWDFALKLSAQVAEINSSAVEPLQNIVWTNISKIGVCSGNPGGACLKAQRELSVRTLRLEITEYDPTLIVFVTGAYGEDIVAEIAGDIHQTGWSKEHDDDWFWWRSAADGMPQIFWTGHPQGKPRMEIERWLQKAAALASHTRH
jgi:hypothetical protein